MQKIAGIYKITNTIDGKAYIGKSVDIKGRLNSHKSMLKNKVHTNLILQKDWNKNKGKNFEFEIIEECSEKNLASREKFYIEQYDSISNGYNLINADTKSYKGTKGKNIFKFRDNAISIERPLKYLDMKEHRSYYIDKEIIAKIDKLNKKYNIDKSDIVNEALKLLFETLKI
jgi:group I intron endonuclease